MTFPTRFTARALAGAAAIALASAAWGQDQSGTNAAGGAEGAGGEVAQLAMAQELYAYGVANDDALAILSAARITDAISTEDTEREAERTEVEGLDIAEDGTGAEAPVDAATMYAKAAEVAGDDEALQALISASQEDRARGRIGGPSRTLSRLPGGMMDTFRIPFYGGVLAEIAIVGDGDSNLDAVVEDENGNVICIDQSWSDKLYCSFTPIWDGPFYISVANMGSIRNSYYLITN
jgi:hypothetical protein